MGRTIVLAKYQLLIQNDRMEVDRTCFVGRLDRRVGL